MPQTEEHQAILNLLGIRQGAVAITKIDRVATDRIDYVMEEIEILLHGSHLAGCPVFPVSAEVGTGMADLRSHLETTARTHDERSVEGHFRLSVDRAFNIQGAGLVVTGAVYSGQVTVGDHLILAAQGSEQPIDARVRGLRALDREANIGRAGQRCAVNITGADINLSRVSRGDWLLAQAVHAPVQKFDARVKVLQSENRPLAHWTPVHVHLGAADITGRIAVLGERRISPGHDELAQLVLDMPIGALFSDRFILRDQSAQRTIAGGMVLDLYPPRRGRARPDRLEMLRAMERAEARTALTAMLCATNNGVNLLQFAKTRNLTDTDVRNLRGHENNICLPSEQGEIVLSQERWHVIEQTILDALANSHKKQPEAVGPNDNGLRISLQTPLPP
ncbi:MAG: selenocysteine-specific translation factor, partial [Alphaproteobacteria bacterium]|nr:selenocysteine-specific translation factor [Alphaproteobacteria bacterium]